MTRATGRRNNEAGSNAEPWRSRRCDLPLLAAQAHPCPDRLGHAHTMNEEKVRPSTGVERLEAAAGPHVSQADDDTIELALTEDEMLTLAQAAEEEHPETSLDGSAFVATGAFLRNHSARFRRWSLVLASSGLSVAIGVALGVVVERSSRVTITVPPWTTRLAESQESPVRFTNPFDPSEVFDFPSGTGADQARESVAAILLQRARDRQAAGIVKSHRPTPGAAQERARIARNSEPRAVSTWR
jgi:hypothetical protein